MTNLVKETDLDFLNVKISEEEKKAIYEFAYRGFPITDIVDVCETDPTLIFEQFKTKKGNVYKIWRKGNMQAKFDIRSNIMESALNSSPTAIKQMIDFINLSEEQNDEIYENSL